MPTQLLIDIGNTAVKFCLCDSNQFGPNLGAVMQCDTQADIAHITQVLRALRDQTTSFSPHNGAALGTCVASAAVKARWSQAVLAVFGVNLRWAAGDTVLAGMVNAYAQPASLGADRWLAAYGAARLAVAQSFVLATFGTATTVDAVAWDAASQRHVFRGGIILAGLRTAWRSVSSATAALPDVGDAVNTALATPRFDQIPNTTEWALVQGVYRAQIGAVQGMVQRMPAHTALYLAGGAAGVMLPLMRDTQAAISGAQPVQLATPVLIGLHKLSLQDSPVK